MRKRRRFPEYYDWLIETYTDFRNLEDLEGKQQSTYIRLARILYETPFIVIVERDNNRVANAVMLRSEYESIKNHHEDVISLCYDTNCSVLEILIDLSKMMASELRGFSDLLKNSHECLFLMLCNLGIDKFDDEYFENYDEEETLNEISMKLDIFMQRSYASNGFGGLFPLKHPKNDQREVELWFQLCAYLLENFNF
jgi:hypothetical protein